MKKYKELFEGNGYDDNRKGFTQKKREDDEYHNEPKAKFKPKSMLDRPHTVHIDGKPWKKFDNGHQANAAVRTLEGKGKKATAVAHFKEEVEEILAEDVEFRLDHRDKVKGDHKSTFKEHEATVSDTTDKATYVKVPAHKADSFKSAMKNKHGVTAELSEARMTAAMKLQKAFQREQEKIASERKAGEELLKKPVKEDFHSKNVAKQELENKKNKGGEKGIVIAALKKKAGLEETLDPSMGAGEYIKDFQKSDAPQFKGKSQEKKRMMGLAAYLQAKDKTVSEGVTQPSGSDKIDTVGNPELNGNAHFVIGKNAPKKTVKEDVVVEGRNEDDVPFDKPYKTVTNKDVKDKSGAVHSPMSRARDLARAAMDRIAPKSPIKPVKEEVETIEEGYDKTSDHHKAARSMAREHGGKATFNSDGTAHVRFNDAVTGRSTVNPKGTLLHTGSEAASRAAKDHGKGKVDGSTVHFKEEVETIEEAVESGNKGYGYHGQHPSETADKEYSKAHATVKKVAGAAGHLKDAKKPNVMVKHYLDSKHGRHLADVGTHDHEYIKKDFGTFKKNYKPELHEAANFDEQGNLMAEKLKFSDFIAKMNEQLLEYESDDSGVYRHTKKATYGNSYQGDDDEDEKPKKAAAPAEKRGRGRPAGSTGASYKPRSAATAAAAKAKAAATKAANKNK